MSQVWVLALYEFLRTWLQRASKLIGYAERLTALKTYMKIIEEEAQEKAKHVKLAPVFYYEPVARVGDEKFIKSIRDYRESIKQLFRDVEAIRMPLAKHEIAGTKGPKFMAEAPGYGRVDTFTGSMYWQIVPTDGTVDVINRHAGLRWHHPTDRVSATSRSITGNCGIGEASVMATSRGNRQLIF